ncbi:hypothetical protein AAVH_12780 [Aphelenchoides avenae]|nr:hypothetical protein AAVH_12780 [Aphelenchus avenae]
MKPDKDVSDEMPRNGPFRILYADPEQRYHKLLPSGRAVPLVDYGPAIVWPREAEANKGRYVVFRVPGQFPGESEDLRFVVVAETKTGNGPPIYHAKCTACFYENKLRENRDLKRAKIGRIFVRAGRLVCSDPRVPEGIEHLCRLIVDDLRLEDPTPKPSRWLRRSRRDFAMPAYRGGTRRTWARAVTKAAQSRLRKSHTRRELRPFNRVFYLPTPAPDVPRVKIEPEDIFEDNNNGVRPSEDPLEPPRPKGRRILFHTTHF